MSGSYGYVSAEGVGIDVAKLRVDILLILIEVGYLGIDRNPLCVQILAGHQNLLSVRLRAFYIGVPAAEGVVFTRAKSGSGIAERLIIRAGLGAVVIDFTFTEIRMVGNVDCNVLDVAVDMIAVVLILDGVPHDLDVFYIEVLAQNRDIGRAVIVGTVRPVILIKETEFSRLNQIVGAIAVNVVDTVGRVIAGVRACGSNACRGERAGVTGTGVLALYAAVRSSVRQVEFFALVMVVIRLTTVRQKYEILSRGQFRFRLSRDAGSPLCVQSQVFVRHRGALPLILESRISVPAVESAVILRNFRGGNRLIGINQTFGGVRAFSARDFTVIQNVSQLMRLYVRGDVNIDGSVVLGLDLVKVKTESVLAVFVFGRVAESGRLEHYTVDGVIGMIANLTDTNRRNLKGLVVPELLGVENLTVVNAAINDNLIGHAAAIIIARLFVDRPVGNVNLNHLGVIGTDQIVEYQLVACLELFPRISILFAVFEIIACPSGFHITNAVDFSTILGTIAIKDIGLMLSYREHASLPENVGFIPGFNRRSCKRGNISAVADSIGDGSLPVAIAVRCMTVSDPALGGLCHVR